MCQQAKSEHVKSLGLLQPLPVTVTPWIVISTNKKDVIMVMVDKFTKYGHFIALSHPFTALGFHGQHL